MSDALDPVARVDASPAAARPIAERRDIVVVMDARASDVSGAVDDAAAAHAVLG